MGPDFGLVSAPATQIDVDEAVIVKIAPERRADISDGRERMGRSHPIAASGLTLQNQVARGITAI